MNRHAFILVLVAIAAVLALSLTFTIGDYATMKECFKHATPAECRVAAR